MWHQWRTASTLEVKWMGHMWVDPNLIFFVCLSFLTLTLLNVPPARSISVWLSFLVSVLFLSVSVSAYLWDLSRSLLIPLISSLSSLFQLLSLLVSVAVCLSFSASPPPPISLSRYSWQSLHKNLNKLMIINIAGSCYFVIMTLMIKTCLFNYSIIR